DSAKRRLGCATAPGTAASFCCYFAMAKFYVRGDFSALQPCCQRSLPPASSFSNVRAVSPATLAALRGSGRYGSAAAYGTAGKVLPDAGCR
ncbi:hypothetical protein NPIL_672301, partial [Nephila pilipes]